MANLAYPTLLAGQRLTAALIQGMQLQYYDISSDATNATTTLADTGLTFSPAINTSWLIQLRAAYACSAAGVGIKMAWSGPSGAGMSRYVASPHNDTTDNQNATMNMIRRSIGTAQTGGSPASTFTTWWEDIRLDMSSTAGAVKLQFAANAAGTATFRASSYFTALRIA